MTTDLASRSGTVAATYARIVVLLEEARLKLREAIEAELDRRDAGLDFVQAMMLYRLGDREVTVSQLRDGCYGRTNVAYNLRLLEARGCVSVTKATDDRRSKRVKATKHGREIGAMVAALLEAQAAQLTVIGDVDPEDLAVTERTLRRMVGFLAHQIAYRL